MQDFVEWPAAAKALAGLFVAIVIAVLWSMLASLVFLAGTGMLSKHQGIPLIDWWLYWWFYGFNHQPIIGLWLKIAAGVATVLPLLLVVVGLLRRGLPGSSRDLHGETRWEKDGALKKEFRARFAGLYLGYTGSRHYLRFGGPEHVAVYAPTRSGKGVGLVIPNCLLYEASLVVLDVKKENWAATAGIRKQMGQKVFLFDPLAPDGCTARYNPLSYVRRGTLDAFDDIQRISQMLFPRSHGDQAFWTNSARSAFVGATSFLAETPELPLTIGEVLRLLSRSDGAPYLLGMIQARRNAGTPYSAATVGALSDYLSGSTDTVQGIRKTITASLALWFNPRVDAATAESDFDLRELRNSLHAIYVGVTGDNIERLQPLLALFFQQLIDLTVRVLPQHDPKAKHQVLVLLDEFPLLGPMPVLANAFAFVAGYNMRLMLVMQSKAQLRDPTLYGPDKAATILDNCGVEVVFGTKDLALSKELSERLGYDTVEGVSRSGPRFWRMFRGKNLNMTESDQRRALLLPQEVMRLRPRDAIVIRPGMYPIKCKRIRHFEDPTFMPLLRPPPVVEPIEVVQLMDQSSTGPASAASTPPPAPVSAPPAGSVASSPTTAPAEETAAKPARGKGKKPAVVSAPVPTVPASVIELVKLRRMSADFALADVRLSGVNLRGLHVARKDGKLSIRPPEQTDSKGESRPLYDLQPGWPEAILARIVELWDQTDDGEEAPAGSNADTVAPTPSPANPVIALTPPEPVAVAEPDAARVMRPFQADALLAGVLGAEVDLGQYGEADSKSIVASIVGATPTVASLNRKGVAAE